MFQEISEFVKSLPPHLEGLWSPEIETQLLFTENRKFRIPKDGGKEDHYYHDHDHHPPMSELVSVGTTGWNWEDDVTRYVSIDLDGLNHAAGFDEQTLDDLVHRLSAVEEVEIIRSKSGQGYHCRVFFDPDKAPSSRTRADHLAVSKQVIRWLAKQGDIDPVDLEDKIDAIGVVAWLYHNETKPTGFQQVKKSTKFMPDDWREGLVIEQADPFVSHQEMPVTATHQKLIDFITKGGLGEWGGKRLNTHTHNLLTAAEELKIKGFATIASGKDGPADRNCFMYPDAEGSWRVYRHSKATKEHESWWKSANGWTTCWFNRPKAKGDAPSILVSIAKDDELFCDPLGRSFVTTKIRGIKETIFVSDARYRAKLRIAYTDKTGNIISSGNFKTASEQIDAIAQDSGRVHPIAIRVAEAGDGICIDMANQNRQIIRVASDGWSVVDEADVRFYRPPGMLPLPMPLRGGTIGNLREFVNVDVDDLPLLLTFIVGCFHPTGPYALLQLCGEQGTAKSCLMRLLHDFIDPHVAVGSTMSKDSDEALVTAQLRWLCSFDNLDLLSRKESTILCMICTGASKGKRKLFTDADQAILKAKRPVIVTSIRNVVTANDLLDRTLTLCLQPIPTEQRKSEFAIEQELRKDGVRGRILGYILDALVVAVRDHANIKSAEMPRMADIFSWAIAAESTLGFEPGAILAQYKRQIMDESDTVFDDSFALRIKELCQEGWCGSATELKAKTRSDKSAKDVGGDLRDISPDLRRQGCHIALVKSNGKRLIILGKKAA